MNERIINDLAVKSGLAEDMGRGYNFPDNYLDFAQLIVKECMNLAITEEEKYSFSNSTPAKYFTAAISDFQGVLAKHFGVEE
jgi:hypothetical protein